MENLHLEAGGEGGLSGGRLWGRDVDGTSTGLTSEFYTSDRNITLIMEKATKILNLENKNTF